MNIRLKLTLQFLFIVSVIFLTAFATIYLTSVEYRKANFYDRLINKASGTTKLLISVDEVDASLLRKIEENNPTTLPHETITIYDARNEILFTTEDELVPITSAAFLDTVREQGEIRFEKDSFEMVGFVFQGLTENSVVITGAVDIFGKRRLHYLRNTLLYVTAFGLLLVFISGWFFSGQALHPIKEIMNRVDEISANKLNLRLNEGEGNDELSRLAKTFNRMLEGLESSFRIQKSFIANASHELRTPLTVITGQLEVELLKDRSAEEYKKTLESVLADIRNLNTISNRLLLLTQTSIESPQVDYDPLRADDIIWQVKSELEKRHSKYRVEVLFDEGLSDDKMLTVSGNQELLKVAFTNLANNGCKYSPDKRVQVKLSSQSNYLILQFTDSGIGIDPEDLPHLFEPFYRGKNAVTFKGHGIGLSLVKRIIAMHRGQVTVKSDPGRETVFTISLPLAQPEF